MMDNQKKCGVGKTCWSFQFVQHSVEPNTTVGEGVPTSHHPLQPRHHQNCSPWNFLFSSFKRQWLRCSTYWNRVLPKYWPS
jgi:hypothetical protein